MMEQKLTPRWFSEPQMFSAARRGQIFDVYRKGDAGTHWDVCKGMVAVVEGVRRYVTPMLLFGVVGDDDSGYSIAVYWHIREDEPWMRRIYSLGTLRNYAHIGALTEQERGLTYAEMVKRVRKEYPKLEMPSKARFYAQFGVTDVEVCA